MKREFYFHGLTIFSMDFRQIRDKFLGTKDADGQGYYKRWKFEGEPMENLLYDFLRLELKAFPENNIQFNRLVNAMICACCGRGYNWYLQQDPDHYWKEVSAELLQYQQDIPPMDNCDPKHAVKFWQAWHKWTIKAPASKEPVTNHPKINASV